MKKILAIMLSVVILSLTAVTFAAELPPVLEQVDLGWGDTHWVRLDYLLDQFEKELNYRPQVEFYESDRWLEIRLINTVISSSYVTEDWGHPTLIPMIEKGGFELICDANRLPEPLMTEEGLVLIGSILEGTNVSLIRTEAGGNDGLLILVFRDENGAEFRSEVSSEWRDQSDGPITVNFEDYYQVYYDTHCAFHE